MSSASFEEADRARAEHQETLFSRRHVNAVWTGLRRRFGIMGAATSTNRSTQFLKPFTLACDEVVTNAVRRDWPMLGSILRGSHSGAFELRPSSLFGLAYLAGGGKYLYRWPSLGAAIELASLGSLALLASAGQHTPAERQIDYQSAAATLSGDFLLARSSNLAAKFGGSVSASLSAWLEELVNLRLDGVAGAPIFAAIFEMPARLGAALSGAERRIVDAMSSFGHDFGAAFSHAEDALALSNERTRLDTNLAGLTAAALTNIPHSPVNAPHAFLSKESRLLHESLLRTAREDRAKSIATALSHLSMSMEPGCRVALEEAAHSLLADRLTDAAPPLPRLLPA